MSRAERPGGMLDMHTHILPGIDDGSSGVRESMEMIRLSVKQGIDSIAMTPHYYPDRESPKHFLKRRESAVQALIRAAREADGMPDMYFGAEVGFFSGISRTDELESLCIGRTGLILIEMPFDRWNQRMIAEITEIREQRGLRPVLAHVERYLEMQPSGTVEELCGQGILLQVNASFFLKRGSALKARHMLKKRQIHLLGSDCHNLKSRPPNLGKALERILSWSGGNDIKYLAEMKEFALKGGGT